HWMADRECGRSFVHRRERYLYKARLAKVGEFPWMVSLHITKKNKRAFCGGSLIKRNIVLTAAHCMRGFLRGYAAAGFLDQKKRGSHYQRRKIETIVCYKDDCGSRRDIALIKLASPFNITKSEKLIGTVCLPRMNRALGREVTITGWGLTSPNIGSQSSRLLAITVPVRDNNFCAGFYPRLFNPKIMFCAGIHGKKQG
ncbi:hypothetical protein HPB47_024667, partial [Ixodes persulcatus]